VEVQGLDDDQSKSMSLSFQVPSLFVKFYSHFPLVSYPPILSNKPTNSEPTLWILPPRQDDLLSADVECLKWQAYLALRGLTKIKVRWDIAPEGSISGYLPNLHIPSDKEELLAARSIPAWVDAKLGVNSLADPLEGYIDHSAMIESRAWVSLLEGIVHATLVCFANSSFCFILTCIS
jgi:metaxin